MPFPGYQPRTRGRSRLSHPSGFLSLARSTNVLFGNGFGLFHFGTKDFSDNRSTILRECCRLLPVPYLAMLPLPTGDARKARAGLRARPSTPDHGCLGFCPSRLRVPPSASEWGRVLCRSDNSQRPRLDMRHKHWDPVSAIAQPEPVLVSYNGWRPDCASQPEPHNRIAARAIGSSRIARSHCWGPSPKPFAARLSA